MGSHPGYAAGHGIDLNRSKYHCILLTNMYKMAKCGVLIVCSIQSLLLTRTLPDSHSRTFYHQLHRRVRKFVGIHIVLVAQ